MRLIGFVDELVKLGTVRRLLKVADVDATMTQEPPTELMGSSDEDVEPADRVSPAEAVTRLPRTGQRPKLVSKETLGGVTEPKEPVDKEKFVRPYEY